ncbi:DUF2306 domain-containing protein [Microbacterium bovistercoris]|uniref:DUF2306 domain-containing protein n=1 Tax=Microbacterium bovistercoris TaxID=2293570 RepID=A0A371NU20_9MICO|nr:DUF2306 domain-containing protein [Microbacterium bovistercoris]REJ05719.1 DUF2306 domain-containing protein [Microbacterium bovistercoris]
MDIQSIIIAVHAIAASFVILIGPVQFLRRRKDARHRLLGRVFGIMMYFVCLSGMFIYSLDGGFTLFHFLAIFTFTTTTIGIIAIRHRNVHLHRGMMIGSWAGTVTAGAFAALIPGRRIPTLAVNDPALLWTIVTAVLVAATALILIALLAPRRAGRDARSVPAHPEGALH